MAKSKPAPSFHVAVYGSAAEYVGLVPSQPDIECLFLKPGRDPETARLEPTPEFVILDLDYRRQFWRTEDEARRTIGAAVDHATVAVGNRAECEIAVGTANPDAAADALLDRGVELAIVKQGAAGVLVAAADDRAVVRPLPVSVVSGHIRGMTNTMPLQVEILYNEYNFVAAFAVASLLAMLAILTLVAKTLVEWRSGTQGH